MAPPGKSRSASSDIGDLQDFIGLAAARRIHFHAIADFLADQRARGRRTDRHLARLHVGLGVADDLEHLLLLGVLVDQRDRRAELDRRPRQLGDVDHLGALQHVLEFDDAALVMGLRLLGGMVFGVLREIAMRARLRDRLDDARAFHLLAALELGLQLRVSGDRDRKLVHCMPA